MRSPPSSSVATRSVDDDGSCTPLYSDQPEKIFNSHVVKNEQHKLEDEDEIEEEEEEEEDGDDKHDDVEEEEIEEEEEEYEEIEVEEEEEIYEEIEVEVEEGEEEEEELLDSLKEVDQKSKDVSQYAEFEGDDSHLRSCSALGKSELRLLDDSVDNSKFSCPLDELLRMQEESYVHNGQSNCLKSEEHLTTNGKNGSQDSGLRKNLDIPMPKNKPKECCELHSHSSAYLPNSEVMAARTTNPISITGNEVSKALVMKDNLDVEANNILDANKEFKPMEMQAENDKKETSRTRSLSPCSGFKDPNKRAAVICDFFAKGWCIRGSSCRFLHVKNKADDAKEQPEGDSAVIDFSKRDQFSEGLRNIMEKPKLPGFPDLGASSIANDTALSCHFSSERILALENGETQKLHQLDDKHTSSSLQREDLSPRVHPWSQKFPPSKEDLGFSFSLSDVATETLQQNWVTTVHGSYASLVNISSSSSLQNSLLPEHRSSSSGSAVTSSNYHSSNPSYYMSILENPMHLRGHYMQASHFDGSLSGSGMLPSHQISARVGESFSFSSPLDACSLGSQKMSNIDRIYRTPRSSLLSQSTSHLSRPEQSLSRDPLYYTEHKAKISSNDWEPSVPFQPSFLITPIMLPSLGGQYDPLHDSIDLPATGYRLPFKFSFVSQGTSMSHQPAYDNSLVHQALGPECSDDKSNAPFHGKFHDTLVDENCYRSGKDTCATGAVTGGSCVVNRKQGTMPKEENASTTGQSKDVLNTNKIDADRDSRNQNDGSKRKKDFKVNRGRQNGEIEVDQKTDGESRALRHFRSALVDFVKDLLKPTWREGHLSKDAHNTIVKKAVDKVLITLRTHQIPAATESIKQYLSSSQPKIAKLVEGYCTKYGKS